jgi:hypothetical protein
MSPWLRSLGARPTSTGKSIAGELDPLGNSQIRWTPLIEFRDDRPTTLLVAVAHD